MKDYPSSFHQLTTEQTLQALKTTPEGLSVQEVTERQQRFGLNALPKAKQRSWIRLVVQQFSGFLIIILIVAAAISYALGDVSDALIILAAVCLNVLVGFVQEWKAERALEALQQVVALHARVMRDGEEQEVPIEQVVPGDVILLSAGDKIPADARIITCIECETNEAVLTGESANVEKHTEPVDPNSVTADQTNMVFYGTTVTRGSATAVVVYTGVRTEVGKIAALLHAAPTSLTPLQNRLNQFARTVGIIVLVISVLLVVVGLLHQLPFVEIFTTAVAVAVSAIPEGLAVAVTIVLAVGMQRILKQHGLVRNLQAAETLGSTTVICTDKTGTLTEGTMRVVSVITEEYHFDDLRTQEHHEGKGLRELLFALNIGMLCNDAHVLVHKDALREQTIVGNLTDRALLQAGLTVGLSQAELEAEEPRIATVPFDSKRKFMATLHRHPKGKMRLYIKGAPEQLLALATHVRVGTKSVVFSESTRTHFQEKFIAASEQGLRILALAYKDMPKDTTTAGEQDVVDSTFVGFVAIQDPLRPDVVATMKRTKEAGIRTVMITGDHPITAQAIARELGWEVQPQQVLTGDELHHMTQDELNAVVTDISIYARVSPEDKLNIIKAWKSKGHIVAMTGDGVNDSPALKAADIGVALGSGTEVAKEASDIVLLDDNFNTIVAAVEEGRGIFDNIRKVVLYLLSDSFSEVIIIGIALLFGIPLPLTAAQILWINLIGDGLPSVALTLDPKDPKAMTQPPRAVNESVLTKKLSLYVVLISLVTGLVNVGIFWYFWDTTGDLTIARTAVFVSLSLDSLIYVFSIRSLRQSVFHKNLFSNRWLLGSVVVGVLALCLGIYVPFLQQVLGTSAVGWSVWSVALIFCVVVVIMIELLKKILKTVYHKTV